MRPTVDDEIERYVTTGKCDPDHHAWPGDIFNRGRQAQEDLRGALVRAVRRAAGRRKPRASIADLDVVALTRAKVEPMVRGLFPHVEHDRVLATLERSAVFLAPSNIETLLRTTQWESTAWDLANLYLASIGAELLGEEAPRIVGLSEGTTFYVSLEYFTEDDPFADFVVHEAAHVFHNCKREALGLAPTRRKEWLLEIEFRKRETFAYACEAYARIVERAPRLRDRSALAREYAAARKAPVDERVERGELVDVVQEAASARNGWKRILARCAAPPPPSRAEWIRSVIATSKFAAAPGNVDA
jgi:hypothetical protein